MASAFITYSYQINFESVLMIHDHEGMLNMFKALQASGLRRFLGCESVLYETELGHFFDTALIQDEDITCVISGKIVSISSTLFATVFDLPSEGITNFSEVPKDKVYDARSLFSQKGVQIDVHGKKKYMKHEFRLLNDILAKSITVKAGSFDSITVERFQMMTAIQYGLKVNWGKVLFNVLKDMVDRSQRKAKGFAAQIGFLLKGIPTVNMGDGVPFPSAKILSMKTVHTYIVTNTTIDARAESEEPAMVKTPKMKKKNSSTDELLVDIFADVTASKKRSATEVDAPIITKKRRTGKSKPSVSQANLDIVHVAKDVEPIQIVEPTKAAATVPSPVLKRKSRKRRLVLSRDSDDESVGTEEIIKKADAAVVMSMVEADIAKVLEETLELGVSATERESQGVDEALFEEDFARWLDDFVARHNEPELVSTNNEAQATGSINSVVDKEVNMPIDDLLIQISDDLLLPITTAEVTLIKLGAFSTSGDKGKGKLVEDEQVTASHAQEIFALICRDVEVMVQVRDSIMQAVVDFFASFSDHQAPASVEFTKFTEALEDLRSSLAQRIDNSNCEMLSKLNVVEVGVRGDILKVKSLLRQSFETACRVLERQSNTQTAQITDLKKGLMAPVGTIFGDLFDIKKKQREQDARLITMDEQIAAIRNEHLEFQSKIAADILSLSTQALEDLRSSLAQRIDNSNCEMLSKLNVVEVGVRGDILKVKSLLRQSFETACRVLERQSNTQTAQITDLKKGLMAPVGTIFGDLFDIKKKQREQDARLITMDEQIAAIRNEHLEFQSKIAADILSLSTQVGDIADFLRGGAAKKGEMGSSSRPSAVRAQTQTLPPTMGTFEERVTQARRHIIETGQVISIEEAAERVIEADRREADRLERERRERRQSRSGTYKRRR
ncbi:delphilin-like [Dorcoceras hygrometricum]|uniref:Delphilin-like n=1 Tax=Dorcoceras hygrometricum TaxID=472368 RepID=A0A2Z7BQ65_9LAMI|nr:delphilin-like [Dorcoceras hygrometricum]